jgi:hypothetical protein
MFEPVKYDPSSYSHQEGIGQPPDFIRVGRVRWYSVLGVPSASLGANNDYAFREDGVAGANTTVYHKEAGTWNACTL